MQTHELEVTNNKNKKLIVSVETYEANSSILTPTMGKKEAEAFCKTHHTIKDKERAKLAEANKAKMEKEALKNKSR